jgi:AraC-like DNA-binding protein
VTKDIIKARIGYARYLLRSSGNSVQDIASYCGYENIEHFNRQFKATVGCTPTQFRNR